MSIRATGTPTLPIAIPDATTTRIMTGRIDAGTPGGMVIGVGTTTGTGIDVEIGATGIVTAIGGIGTAIVSGTFEIGIGESAAHAR